MTFLEAVQSGDRRRALEELRDHLAEQLLEVRAAVAIAPIANQLRDVIRELDAMPPEEGTSPVDQLAKKRETRRAAAASGAKRSKVSDVGGA